MIFRRRKGYWDRVTKTKSLNAETGKPREGRPCSLRPTIVYLYVFYCLVVWLRILGLAAPRSGLAAPRSNSMVRPGRTLTCMAFFLFKTNLPSLTISKLFTSLIIRIRLIISTYSHSNHLDRHGASIEFLLTLQGSML